MVTIGIDAKHANKLHQLEDSTVPKIKMGAGSARNRTHGHLTCGRVHRYRPKAATVSAA
ncbi:hypothetical protein PCA20602_02835 [Pandoraea capi]|uniref:Uncharacterized protein n=1 Tax=Pandoraea capi TaxID=2508286 RepID=A0ABY6W1J0_9BURK|nr:hypothetical protein PCA20602_02835 [Pandoraea capi]